MCKIQDCSIQANSIKVFKKHQQSKVSPRNAYSLQCIYLGTSQSIITSQSISLFTWERLRVCLGYVFLFSGERRIAALPYIRLTDRKSLQQSNSQCKDLTCSTKSFVPADTNTPSLAQQKKKIPQTNFRSNRTGCGIHFFKKGQGKFITLKGMKEKLLCQFFHLIVYQYGSKSYFHFFHVFHYFHISKGKNRSKLTTGTLW